MFEDSEDDECKPCGPGDDEKSGEARKVKKMLDPVMPSKDVVDEHNLTHLPYRNWCKHCVKGRGKEMDHVTDKKKEGIERTQPEFHADFCFPGDEDKEKNLTVMVVRERLTKMMMASVVPTKSTGTFIAKRIVAFMKEVGCEHADVTMKSDQEEAMKAIMTEVSNVRASRGSGRTVVEMSKKKDSQSNGFIERAIQSEEAQVRVSRSALEERLGVKIPVVS